MSFEQPRPSLPPAPMLVAGLGRAGKAAADALAARLGADAVFAFDDRSTPATRAVARDLEVAGIAAAAGERPQHWPAPAAVVKSPGIPFDAPTLPIGVPTIDELELGWRLTAAPVVGVTGTNGKGTTCSLIAHLLTAAGRPALACGNYELGPPLSAATVAEDGVLVVEASSFQLEGTSDFLPELAVMTNLGNDHLNRHGTRAAYAAVKQRLFIRDERAISAAVLPADDPFGQDLATKLRTRGSRVVTFGRGETSDYRVASLQFALDGSELEIDTPSGATTIATPLPGEHNALNVVAALAAAETFGVDRQTCREALAGAPRVPGRLERIDVGQPFTAIVDYAHNPHGYEAVLNCARELTDGRLRVLIGVMGGMDQSKRPVMGLLAGVAADQLFVTSSDRRAGEAPEVGIEQLLAGARSGDAEIVVEPDRRRAIEALVAAAEPRDLILVLGRGAARRPLDESDPEPFDDRHAVRAALAARWC